MSDSDNTDTKEQQREHILSLVKEYTDITEFKSILSLNNYDLKELNENDNFDLLIYCIENNVNLRMIKFVFKQCEYKNLNYSILSDEFGRKSPLLSALSKNSFDVANFLLKNGANIHYELFNFDILYYLEGLNQLNERNLKFIISNGFNIKLLDPLLLSNFIDQGQDNYIKIIMKSAIFDNFFIMKLLNFTKNKIGISNKDLIELINYEKSKIVVRKDWYEKAIAKDNYNILEFICNNDTKNKSVIFMEVLEVVGKYDKNHHTNKRFELLKKIKKGEFCIQSEVPIPFIDKLVIPDNDKHRKEITEYIENDDLRGLKEYITNNNITINDVNSETYDLLICCIENKASAPMFLFLLEKGQYTNVNYFIKRGENEFQTPLIAAIANSQYKIADILFIKGADGNFNIKDMIPPENNNSNAIVIYLYEKNLLNASNLFYLIMSPKSGNLFLPHSLVNKFIDNFNNDLMEVIFQNCPIPIHNQLYHRAFIKDNFELIEILFECDKRPKEQVAQIIIEIIYGADPEGERRNAFLDGIKNKVLKEEIEKVFVLTVLSSLLSN